MVFAFAGGCSVVSVADTACQKLGRHYLNWELMVCGQVTPGVCRCNGYTHPPGSLHPAPSGATLTCSPDCKRAADDL